MISTLVWHKEHTEFIWSFFLSVVVYILEFINCRGSPPMFQYLERIVYNHLYEYLENKKMQLFLQ